MNRSDLFLRFLTLPFMFVTAAQFPAQACDLCAIYGATRVLQDLRERCADAEYELPRADRTQRERIAREIEELHGRIENRSGCRICTMYGMTEAFPIAVWGVADEAIPGSAGRTSPLLLM